MVTTFFSEKVLVWEKCSVGSGHLEKFRKISVWEKCLPGRPPGGEVLRKFEKSLVRSAHPVGLPGDDFFSKNFGVGKVPAG
jgi:hypothetical protein